MKKCSECDQPVPEGRKWRGQPASTCSKPCVRARDNRLHREKYARRIAEGRCVYIGCPDRAAPGRTRCPAHNEKNRERRARWREENREEHRECCARWRAENRDKAREYGARYYAENQDRIREYNASPDRRTRYAYTAMLDRADPDGPSTATGVTCSWDPHWHADQGASDDPREVAYQTFLADMGVRPVTEDGRNYHLHRVHRPGSLLPHLEYGPATCRWMHPDLHRELHAATARARRLRAEEDAKAS